MKDISIKYHNPALIPAQITKKGNWIDLRSAESVDLKPGETYKISLGVSMQLPRNYEAHVCSRSSTFKHWGITPVNGMGIIDSTYCGDRDIWFFEVMAFKETKILFNDRICQFRIIKRQPKLRLKKVFRLGNKNRGGYGSTGKV